MSVDERRQHDRAPGPFDEWRVGLLDVPVRIYDISEGGCFVSAMHEQQAGIVFVLKVDLPHAGWMTDETLARLRRAAHQLTNPGPNNV